MKDPRRLGHNQRHELSDILAVSILATICGADNWVEMEEFAHGQREWLESFLSFPNGIPSHDTFSRVFMQLDSAVFEECFVKWVKTLRLPDPSTRRDVIAIDGKTSRASHNKHKNINPLHMVSAWSVENKLCLGQVRTAEKSNEIEAIPRLLEMLDVKGSIVTLDAMGCQKEIAATIRDKGADYVLALKDNHPKLSQSVKTAFELGDLTTYTGMHYLKRTEKIRGFKNRGEHGRVETRKYTLITVKDKLVFGSEWPGLVSFGRLEVTRTVRSKEVERSTRYFLTSLDYQQMEEFMHAARRHWEVEINLHWSLDVSFADDLNRTRTGNGAENISILKRIALNALKRDNTRKIGITAKRKKAAWDNKFLTNIINNL